MNGNEPATKSDLLALKSDVLALKSDLLVLESRFDAKLSALESRFDGKLDTLEQRMLDRMGGLIHDSETRLLQAFYSFAETNNKRLAQFEATDVLLLTRVTTLESRVLEVEKRLNIPPAA
jgi:hypothetical protein